VPPPWCSLQSHVGPSSASTDSTYVASSASTSPLPAPICAEQVEQGAGITGHERDVVPARNLDPSQGGGKHPAAGVDPDDAAGRPDRCKRGREVQAGAAPHIDHGGPRRQGQHFE